MVYTTHNSMVLAVVITASISIGILYFSSRKETMKQPPLWQIHSSNDIAALFAYDAAAIAEKTERYLHDVRNALDAIIAVPDNQRNFANTAQALDSVATLSNAAIAANIFSALENLSPKQSIRDEAHNAQVRINQFFVDQIDNNRALYRACKAYVDGNARTENLREHEWYYLHNTIKDFERYAGLKLPDEQLAHIIVLKKELTALALQFERNIAADTSSITVSADGLDGLDEDFITSLARTADGTYILAIDYPTFFTVIDHCTVEDTRKQLYIAFANRAFPANDTILKHVIEKRDQLAQLLGFKSYAALDLDNQMVQHVDHAQQFIADLIEKSRAKEQQEIADWTSLLPPSVNYTADGKIKPWDMRYLQTMYKKKHLALDERILAEYFPMEHTIAQLLDIYRQFLGIELQEVPLTGVCTGVWHEDVKLVQVYTADKSKVLGYLLLDLFPRPNKYSHAAHLTVIPAVCTKQGNQPAVSVVAANFPKPTNTKPSLLKRDDVKTFFHEFGHALHAILGATQMASQAGTKVKSDFVEMPSQMLEEWLWDRDILRKVSKHYKTGQPLSDELIDKMLQLKHFDTGNWVQTQACYALLSLACFVEGAQKDPYTIERQLYTTMRPHILFDPNNHTYASFGHLMGYGAKYYGYLWSLVFALDLFSEIKKYGLLNKEIGQKYVREVIGKGGSQDPNILLKNFLGREPNSTAFFDDLGLHA